jgi:hypothetical protein
MSWPLSQDYNEAIQDPNNSFSDAELKTGEAVANALGIPMPRSGNFADVYEVRCPSGSRWAVKCFTRQVSGLSERYSEIGKYLRLANLPFMVDFKYLEQGIRVRGQWYPILKMQWVEGFVLNQFVRDNLDKKPILNALGQIWLRMARRLRESYIAHCDLQHGNVLFVPGSTAKSLAVKLIDYDGMCVPSLAGTKSGEVGHPAFQHPERLRSGAYNQEVDRFALLTIATALRCLTVGGRVLWERYDNGDNLLFRSTDLQAPAESPLFQELLAIGDPQAQTLVKELYRACQGPMDDVPLLTDVLPEEKPAGKVTTAVAKQPTAVAVAQGPDWDFQGDEASASVVKQKRPASKSSTGKIPVWVWGAGAAALVLLLLGAGVGVGLALRKGPAEKEAIPVAQNKPETITPLPVKLPVDDGPRKPPKEPQLVPVKDDHNPAQPVSPESASSSRIFQLTPAGDALAVAGDEQGWNWRLIEPGTRRLIREFRGHTGTIVAIAFSPDGKFAVTVADNKILKVWDVQSGKEIHWCPRFSDKKIVSVALAPDGQRVAWADDSKVVSVWNFENKSPHTYGHGREVSCVAFSPDGRYLFCGFDKGDASSGDVLLRWELKAGGASRSYRGASGRVCSVAVSPDGKYLAAAQAGEHGSVAVWEQETGILSYKLDLPGAASRELLFSPDSRYLLAESSKGYRGFLVGQKGRLVLPKDSIADHDHVSAAFTADSRKVIFAYGKGNVINTDTASLPAPAAETVVVKPPPQAPKAPAPRNTRQPLPDAAAVEAAVKDIRERHKGDPRDKLITALWQETNTARNDPIHHFALLREIRDLNAEGNVRAALSTTQQMAQSFDVSLLEMECVVLERSTKSGRTSSEDILELGLPLVDRAVGEEDYAVLNRLVKMLRITVGKLGDAVMLQNAQRLLARAESIKKEHDKLKPQLDVLAANSDDAKANLAVGKFHCIMRGDWLVGLPILAHGGDDALKVLADKDLASPDDADAQKALGDDWARRAEKVSSTATKMAYQRRAYYWYQQAAAQLKGAKQSEVKIRLAALARAVPELKSPLSNLGIYERGATPDPTTGAVRFRPNGTAATRQFYKGPIDIRVVVRSMKTDLNILIGDGGRLILGQDPFKKIDRLQVFRPDDTQRFGFGSKAVEKPITLPNKTWFSVRWRISAAGMKVWIDDQLQFEEERACDRSGKHPVTIHCNDEPIEVKSVIVKRAAEK